MSRVSFRSDSQQHPRRRSRRYIAPPIAPPLQPNDASTPDAVDRGRLVEQLRYGGVLEAVRVARAGFPVRYPHAQFVERYASLSPQFHAKRRAAAASRLRGSRDELGVAPSARELLGVLAIELGFHKKKANAATPQRRNGGGGNSHYRSARSAVAAPPPPPSGGAMSPSTASAFASGTNDDVLEALGARVGKTKVFLRERAVRRELLPFAPDRPVEMCRVCTGGNV